MSALLFPGRAETGHIRLYDRVNGQPGNALPGDWVQILTDTYEFCDLTHTVTPGNVPVLIGATAMDTVTALTAAIMGQQRLQLTALQHPEDRCVVDLALFQSGEQLYIRTNPGMWMTRGVILRNCETLAPHASQLYGFNRLVMQEDVARGRIRINTQFGAIDFLQLVWTRGLNGVAFGFNGTTQVNPYGPQGIASGGLPNMGGVIEVSNNGSVKYQVGDFLAILVIGH